MQILTIARVKNRARFRRSLPDNCCGKWLRKKLICRKMDQNRLG